MVVPGNLSNHPVYAQGEDPPEHFTKYEAMKVCVCFDQDNV